MLNFKSLSVVLSLLLMGSISLCAQDKVVYEDRIFVDHLRTVQFGPAGFQFYFPLISLEDQGQLMLSFDDLEAGVKDYTYTVIHCDRDWTPSTLNKLEYIDGFEEDDIQQFDFSFNTLTNYTHYELLVPNRNMQLTKSGNYLLVIYEDEAEKIPVITRRFVVVDRRVGISARLSRPAEVSKIRTHQEVDFFVDFQQLNVRNPMLELRASVIQNRRWDNAIYNIEPRMVRGTEAVFDYQGKVVFPAGNEFRFIDLRSLRAPQSDIDQLRVVDDTYVEGSLRPLTSRANNTHLAYGDLNGGFAIENFDQRTAELSGEYVDLLITYQVPGKYEGQALYLVGGFTDWQLKPEFRMKYNPAISAYVGRVQLKQGYYNYFLATVPEHAPADKPIIPSTELTEGNYDDTENDYLILIYYRPFGTRYDQVVGAYQFNSIQN
ncbi:MAG: DUF5103 domain-containing protein [Bacteroidetes bacterium]|nr:MAG: DUF5103 domain-containing protein [Bacteroidota bacterium]